MYIGTLEPLSKLSRLKWSWNLILGNQTFHKGKSFSLVNRPRKVYASIKHHTASSLQWQSTATSWELKSLVLCAQPVTATSCALALATLDAARRCSRFGHANTKMARQTGCDWGSFDWYLVQTSTCGEGKVQEGTPHALATCHLTMVPMKCATS